MSKIELSNVSSGYDLSVINANFQKIEDELNNKVLYRNSPEGEPNTLETPLDVNGKRIYNLAEPLSNLEPARLRDVQNAINGVTAANLINFTPAGGLSSDNVQAALQELDTEKMASGSLEDSSGSSLVGFINNGTSAIERTVEDKLLESLSVKDFGAVGDGVADDRSAIIAADAAAKAAGAFLKFPRGVYRCSDGIARTAHWIGEGSPQLAPFPLSGDDKQYLRPGYKSKIPGSSLLFTGTGTATATTQRTDGFASFTYCVKDSAIGLHMKDLGIILDVNIYDAGGALTAYGADNSAVYGVGHYIDDVAQCLISDVVVFGYFTLAGTVVHSVLGNDDPDYTIFRGGSTMGRYGLALIGSEFNDGFDSGLSGTMSYGMDIFTLDHHSRTVGTAPTIYASANTWRCIYIDGYTDASNADINGHFFFGGSIRTYAINPVELDCASQTNFIGCTFETSDYAGAPYAETKQWIASSNTENVGITNCRFAGDVGLFRAAFGGVMKGQLTLSNCAGLAVGGGLIVSEANGGTSYWIKIGGASGSTGDPAIQLGSGSATSSTSGWSIRRDIDNSDTLDFRWNGTSVNTMSTSGGFGRFGYVAGSTRTIATGSITIAGYSYYRVANEGGASTDDLETIVGGSYDGQILILAAALSTQDVVCKDGVGNLRLSSDFTLTHSQDRLTLQWDGATWNELSRSDNTA